MLIADTCVAPPVKPVPVGADQLYKVPLGTTPLVTSVGVTVKATPLHVVVLIGVTIACGLMLTVTVNDVAGPQSEVLGIIVYVAVCAVLVGLNRLPVITDTAVALAPPVSPPVTDGVDQLYVVPAGTIPLIPSVGVTVNDTPLQVTVVIAVITAVGLIVTVTVKVVPIPQLTMFGVTI